MSVVPWLTSERFRDSKQTLQDLASNMRADAIVSGSVRRSGDRILVTASLVDARPGMQKWSDEFEEPSSDALAVERRIATGVVTGLALALTPDQSQQLARGASANPQAYDLYLKGRAINVVTRGIQRDCGRLVRKGPRPRPTIRPRAGWARVYEGSVV